MKEEITVSWDVLVFNFNGTIPSDEVLSTEGYQPPPLGEAQSVRDKIAQSVPTVDWSDQAWGILNTPDFQMQFNLQVDGLVTSFMIHVYGSGQPLPIIQKICQDNGWHALDTGSDWLDLDNPSNAGWQGYQRGRNQLIEDYKARNEL
jgi:hypothetical protein